jgi:hypothetical protein
MTYRRSCFSSSEAVVEIRDGYFFRRVAPGLVVVAQGSHWLPKIGQKPSAFSLRRDIDKAAFFFNLHGERD